MIHTTLSTDLFHSKISLSLTITRRQILDSSKLKEFVDNNFKFDENGRKLSMWVENTVGKGEIARDEQFLLFPQCFQKACFPGALLSGNGLSLLILWFVCPDLFFMYYCVLFLAHLSTTCSRGAFRVTGCPSSVVLRQQFFKHQLLLNRWANLDQTWQECSLGGPL